MWTDALAVQMAEEGYPHLARRATTATICLKFQWSMEGPMDFQLPFD